MANKQVLYLIGAGRSGTTALATFLGNNESILHVGEMHQFFEHLAEEKPCSCRDKLDDCIYWANVIENLPDNYKKDARSLHDFSEKLESHSSIPKHLFKMFSKDTISKYITLNEQVFDSILINSNKSILLDSSKYIGRAISLSFLKSREMKVIYVVRDIRGVINSFSKNVQTPKKPLNTILYYLLINIIAELVSRILFKKKVIKIKYEDLIDDPIRVFENLEAYIKVDLSDIKERLQSQQPFSVGHIVGGNRLKNEREIYFKKDESWKTNMPFFKSIIYYFMGSPIMFINKFKI